MTFAYADPPYLGQAGYYRDRPDWEIWNDPETHRELIARLVRDFPDGWALSLHTPSLRTILPMCPPEARTCGWFKTFASFKPGVGQAYAWEPVIVMGGRKRGRDEPTVRDWCAVPITLRRGFTGAKPRGFCRWLFDFMGARPDDTFADLFPGSGAVTKAWDEWRQQLDLYGAGRRSL